MNKKIANNDLIEQIADLIELRSNETIKKFDIIITEYLIDLGEDVRESKLRRNIFNNIFFLL